MNIKKVFTNNKFISAIVLIFSSSFIFLHYLYIKPWMLDDAFISFRYAHNFAEGNGIVFNIGDFVEGYTSFLWVIILGFGEWIGFNIVALSKILGFLFSISTLLIILTTHNKKFSYIALFLIGTCGVFTAWASSGMEVALYTFLITASFVIFKTLLKQQKKSLYILLSISTAIITLTRPEGIILFITLLLCINLHSLIINKRIAVDYCICYVAPYFFIIGAQEAFRYYYYQDWLPNTFYNKVGSGISQYLRGIRYIKQFLTASFFVFIPIIAWLGINYKKLFLNIKLYFYYYTIGIFSLIYTVYVLYVGGDVMPAYRFFTPLLPILSIFSAFSINQIIEKIKLRKTKIAFTIGITSIICIFNLLQWKYNFKLNHDLKNDHVAEYGTEVGLWMKDNFPEDTVLATNTAGSIPYYSGLYTIDMLGLNDKHIAKRYVANMGEGFPGHEKTDGVYILSKNPDIIQLGSSLGSDKPILVSDKELDTLEEFKNKYSPKEFPLPSERKLILYLRNDFNKD